MAASRTPAFRGRARERQASSCQLLPHQNTLGCPRSSAPHVPGVPQHSCSPAPSRPAPRKKAEAALRPIKAPALIIWGQRDRYLGPELAEPDHDDFPGLDRVERLPDASH
jgi:pimeloyl-ACP methyl ester carboxylesterase